MVNNYVVDFFKLTNPEWLAISLAIAFEVGAAASLASIIALEKMNKFIVWMLFIILTLMQAMGNTYYAYVHAENFQTPHFRKSSNPHPSTPFSPPQIFSLCVF